MSSKQHFSHNGNSNGNRQKSLNILVSILTVNPKKKMDKRSQYMKLKELSREKLETSYQ